MNEIEAKLTLERVKLDRKKGRFGKAVVVSVFLLIIAYTAIVLWFSAHSLTVPDSLTMAFFAAMVGEFSALGIIKSRKLKGDKTNVNQN